MNTYSVSTFVQIRARPTAEPNRPNQIYYDDISVLGSNNRQGALYCTQQSKNMQFYLDLSEARMLNSTTYWHLANTLSHFRTRASKRTRATSMPDSKWYTGSPSSPIASKSWWQRPLSPMFHSALPREPSSATADNRPLCRTVQVVSSSTGKPPEDQKYRNLTNASIGLSTYQQLYCIPQS